MSAGAGYKYLLHSVVAGDGNRDRTTPLTRYYQEAGTPPGHWLGAGLGALNHPHRGTHIVVGDEVSEQHLERLIGHGCHPVTGEQLGRPYFRYPKPERTTIASPDAEPPTKSAMQRRHPVAGYDYTFSVPKSVSVLWGLADSGTQELLAATHHAAVTEVIGFMEGEVVATRMGASSKNGAVVQTDVTGVIATAYDHWDSRAGDPQLHTHVVVSNKVNTIADGKWRAIDGRPMHAATVAVSELYNAVLADKLTATVGLAWQQRERGRNRNPAWELRAVPQPLIDEFSTRSKGIESETDRLIADHRAAHGRSPSQETLLHLRQQATLETRPDKQLRSMAAMTTDWRQRATPILGTDAIAWAGRIVNDDASIERRHGRHVALPSPPSRQTDVGTMATRRRAAPVVLRADDVPADVASEVAASVLAVVANKRSTWTRWNLHAEASRQLMGWRFASLADRNAITSNVVAAAEQASLKLTPDALAAPQEFTRDDGTSRFRPRNHDLFTSHRLLDAESAILALSRDAAGPRVQATNLDVESGGDNFAESGAIVLGDDQRDAIHAVATSGRVVDVLVGPAGAGKTTTLAELHRVWEAEHGADSVIGLAPSATAAAVLGEELGIATENTAKWWYDHQHHGQNLNANQLVIVDEASLAGTFSLHQIATHSAEVGAKLLLVGDYAQLQSVTAGGAFQLLVDDRNDAPELIDVHRFRADWEKAASLQLRHANPQALDAYEQHDRISGGDLNAMVEHAYSAWRADLSAGRSSLLIADNNETVSTLNERARADRIATGSVGTEQEVALRDGLRASRGDLIVTRQNDRRLIAGKTGWVRNGDRWLVLDVLEDGAAVVRREGLTRGGTITLPANYVAEHVELGYAVTAHRAQGATVETAHAIITENTARENLYVAMTRGRSGNHAYVATDTSDHVHAAPHPDDQPQTARRVLARVLARSGAEPSAHQAAVNELASWGSVSQLGAEYETLHDAAKHERWTSVIRRALPKDQADSIINSDRFDTLVNSFQRVDAEGLYLDMNLLRILAERPLDADGDLIDQLSLRVGSTALKRIPAMMRPGYSRDHMLGMYEIPSPYLPVTAEMKHALTERETALNARAEELLNRAISGDAAWLRGLGSQPQDPDKLAQWRENGKAVAAYRERYETTGPELFGTGSDLAAATPGQRRCAERIQEHITEANRDPEREAREARERALAQQRLRQPAWMDRSRDHWTRTNDYGLSR